jgi:hypothetical protein
MASSSLLRLGAGGCVGVAADGGSVSWSGCGNVLDLDLNFLRPDLVLAESRAAGLLGGYN